MDLLTAAPLRARSITWQEHPGQWMLTVVCKATYTLAADRCPLAPEQEDVAESDNHWDDDPRRSLYAPGDLAPYKAKPEVVLVGSAFAHRGQVVRKLPVRLICAGIDKTIDVYGPRTRERDGTIVEGPAWSQMPLRYERAAGGESWNPVGVDPEVQDAFGRRPLPNLQPPGAAAKAAGAFAPVGFGPISSTWRVRRDKLGHRAATWSDRGWSETPLGAGFDMSFFQAAPTDQQVTELRPDQPFVLENMHPDLARLVTGLPGVRPRVMVDPAGDAGWELPMVADTLWIDTGRALCTLTWRGRMPLERRDQRGRIRVGVEEPGRAVQWPAGEDSKPQRAIPPQPPIPRAPPPRPPAPTPSRAEVVEEISVLMETVMGEPIPSDVPHGPDKVLPFVDAPSPSDGNPFSVRTMPFAKPVAEVVRPPPGAWAPGATGTMNVAHALGALAMPFREAPQPPAAAPEPPPPPSQAGSPPALSQPMPPPFGGFGGLPPVAAATATPQPSFAKPTFVTQGAFLAPPGLVAHTDAPPTAYAGVLEASNAAVSPPEAPARLDAVPAASIAAGSPLVEIIWFDPVRAPFLARQGPAWAEMMSPPVDLPPDDPGLAEAWAKVDRADVAAVLTRATPQSDVQGAVNDAVTEDGLLDTPVVMVAGDLEISFDEVETLKLHLAGATPLAGADKKLKDTVDLATEVQKTPFAALPEVAAGWSARIREAWVKAANRTLPADYLETHCRRLLLEQRAYQRRDLCNETWIRAAITPTGGSTAVPTYLPDAVARWLPLFSRFPARILAEAVPQQDEAESAPCALRAVAIARVLSGRGRTR